MNHAAIELALCSTFAVLVAAGGVTFLQRHAAKLGLVDLPDVRKQHGEPVPVVGGLAVAFAFVLTGLLCRVEARLLAAFAVASLPLLLIGLLDDKQGLNAREKLAAQSLVAAIAVFGGGVVVHELGDLLGFGVLALGWFAIPFTIVCLVGTINAFNMTDGVDGLAGGLALVSVLAFGGAAALLDASTELSLAVALGGALVGFLCFNLQYRARPFRVFLGDSGSTFLGFALAWLAVAIAQRPGGRLYPIAAVWVLGVPLLDMGTTMVLRATRGHNPLAPDRTHLHHLLAALGLSPKRVVVIEVGAAALLAGVGLGAWRHQVPEALLTYGFLATALVYLLGVHLAWRQLGEPADRTGA